MSKDEIKNDLFIEKWRTNYDNNFSSGIFSNERAKPFIFLQNTKPYTGKPCVLVAAGPSVDKNIAILKNYQKNVIILAVDVILFKLLEHGIYPDFVVSVDPSDLFVRFWGDLDTSQISLICPTSAHPNSLKAWKGQYIFYNQSDIPNGAKGKALQQMTKKTGGYGSILNGYFVGATALRIASLLGLTPAILVGYDFSYPEGRAYCDGFLDRKIYDDLYASDTEEHEEQLEKLKKMEVKGEIKMKDINGKFIETSRLLDFYRKSFLQLNKYLRIPIINSTEGGTLLGVPCMKLKDSLEKFCSNEIDKKDVFNIKPKRRKRRR